MFRKVPQITSMRCVNQYTNENMQGQSAIINNTNLVFSNIDDNYICPLESQVTSDHRTNVVTHVNHFVTEMINFLNKFSMQCEWKSMTIEHRLENIQNEIALLEAKIPQSCIDLEKKETIEISDEVLLSSNQEDKIIQPNYENDPEFEKYFKMVRFGVPVNAVELKMRQDGKDPSVLSR